METQEGKDGGKECCAKAKCCGGKALAAIALLAVGGLGGYFCGRKCAVKEGPPAASASVENPAR